MEDRSRRRAELKTARRLHARVQVTGWDVNLFHHALAILALSGALGSDELGDLVAPANKTANAFGPAHFLQEVNARFGGSKLGRHIYDRRRILHTSSMRQFLLVCQVHNHRKFSVRTSRASVLRYRFP